MSLPLKKITYSVDDIDMLDSIIKEHYELINGQIVLMGGASADHGILTSTIGRLLGNQLKKPCTAIVESMRVKANNNIFRPDVTVICHRLKRDQIITDSPSMIVEVLSKSTEIKDRNEKLFSYLKIPTLKAYLIVDKYNENIEVFQKENDNVIRRDYFRGDILSIEDWISLDIGEIYDALEDLIDED